MSYLEKLTEGIRERSLAREGEALLEKWEKTGLLEGLGDDTKRSAMSRLLENQAAQLLKEASSMAAGDVEGFASVAFPIVRRVFGGLLAQDLVSVQPMSLPSGLVFFLDFTLGTNRGGSGDSAALNEKGKSIYGGRRIGSQLTGGIDLSIPDPAGTTNDASFRGGAYDLANGYSTPTGSANIAAAGRLTLPGSRASIMMQISWLQLTTTRFSSFVLKSLRLRMTLISIILPLSTWMVVETVPRQIPELFVA